MLGTFVKQVYCDTCNDWVSFEKSDKTAAQLAARAFLVRNGIDPDAPLPDEPPF